MIRVSKNTDETYTLMPITKSGADFLDYLYKAYKEWSENECKKFTVVDYRDRTDLHESNQSQSRSAHVDKLP